MTTYYQKNKLQLKYGQYNCKVNIWMLVVDWLLDKKVESTG